MASQIVALGTIKARLHVQREINLSSTALSTFRAIDVKRADFVM